MTRGIVITIVAGFSFIAGTHSLRGNPQQDAQAAAADRHAVLAKYCFGCHNAKLKSGGLALSTLDLANLSKDPNQVGKSDPQAPYRRDAARRNAAAR